ncbi:MAG: hypothetical protein II439_03940, partial [Firmicutes bacterium]|nr:hypothetical protein [Bacillota bacterium]
QNVRMVDHQVRGFFVQLRIFKAHVDAVLLIVLVQVLLATEGVILGEFVVLSKDGYIRTYFWPDSGKKYYDKQ